jgi:hypothetical protein
MAHVLCHTPSKRARYHVMFYSLVSLKDKKSKLRCQICLFDFRKKESENKWMIIDLCFISGLESDLV